MGGISYGVAILLLWSGIAFSQNPIPGSAQKATSPQTHSANANQPTTNNQRGTPENPFVVEIKNAPQAGPQATKDENQSNNKSTFIWGMTAEEATAVFTGLLVVVGAATALVLICQSILLRTQVKLARAEYLASHPPDLIVRRVGFINGRPGYIQYIILNNGESDAEITNGEIRAFLVMGGDRPFFPPYNEGIQTNQLGGIRIPVGEQVVREVFDAQIEASIELLIQESTQYNPAFEAFIVGWMRYRNRGGTSGYTAFGRVYNAQRDGFVIVEDAPGTPEHDRWEYRQKGER